MIQAKELYNNPSLNLQMETDFFKFLFYIYIPTQKINLGWNYFIAQKKKKKSEDQCQTILLGNCPKWLSGKESAYNVGDEGSILRLGRSPGSRRKWQPSPVFLPGKFQRQRSLTGYSPWGHQSQTQLRD